MQTLNQDIKEKKFRPVYLLYGEEAFLKNSYKKRLKDAIVGDDLMNFSSFEGKNTDVDEIIRLADTMPFFAERRMILIEDSGLFKSGGESMCEYLPQMPDTATLVFVESDVDKRSRLFKKVKELGHQVEFTRQEPEQLARWAAGILGRSQKRITARTMDLFLGMVGDDMENIRQELEKLIAYTGERDVITDDDIYAICTEHITGKVFDLVADIANGKKKEAMERYEDLLTLKETPTRILFLITRQFNQILQVKELSARGLDRKSIASRLKVQPFVVGRVLGQAKRFTKDEITQKINLCIETEEAVKSGKLNDKLAVELIIAA